VRARAGDLDRFQRRHPAVGLPVAVVYKFFDDQGNYLAAVLTYYAFVAIFPLLLIGSSILGFVLQGNPELEQEVLDSALSQFPIVGEQLGAPEGLQGSTTAVVVGALTALYGATGLGQAGQTVMHEIWGVPRNTRPNPVIGRFRSLLLLSAAGLALLVVAVATSLASHVELLGDGTVMRWTLRIGSVLLAAGVLALMFRLATESRLSVRAALPGAVLIAVLWEVLQLAGGAFVEGVVTRVSSVNAVFALVLGLVATIYVASVVAVLGAELNVVRTQRLYPRALLTPFTDDVELTSADRRAYRSYAQAQRHKGFERVEVSFEKKKRGRPSRR
jgi:YihY family inner membrane protein